MEDHFLEGLELLLFGLKGRFKEGTLGGSLDFGLVICYGGKGERVIFRPSLWRK